MMAGDDWTTALAKRWQYTFIQLFTAHIRSSTTLANSLYKRSSSGLGRSNHSERSGEPGPFRSTMREWHLAVARGPMGGFSQLSHEFSRLPLE